MLKTALINLSAIQRSYKKGVLVLLDACILPLLMWIAYSIRLFEPATDVMSGLPLWFAVVSVLGLTSLWIFGIYHAVIRSFNENLILRLALATILVVVALYVLSYAHLALIPMSIPLMFGFLLFAWVWGSRAFIRFLVGYALSSHIPKIRVAIYGAGSAGQQMATALHRSPHYLPVCFLDDQPNLQGQVVTGLKVYSPKQLIALGEKYAINEVLLAIPSMNKQQKIEIIKSIEPIFAKVREVPSLEHLVDGQLQVSDIREVDIVDLLGRDPVPPKYDLLDKNITDKVVMVTGAGGSIGSELCRQIIKRQPKLLILFEQSEFSLYSIEKELSVLYLDKVIPILGTVLNQDKLIRVMTQYAVQTVYHAAAYKHVPLVESNPIEGLRNNSVGTAKSLNAAVMSQVETFVLISTDKAVRPTNVMGASKRIAELYCQAIAAQTSKTKISIVRFGNVLGSSGSVVPLFKQQIAKGGPITVTHPEVTRYFMTIPEAALLVIQAGAMGQGGDVFLLDMGESVKIRELAAQMVRLSGLKLKQHPEDEGDIEIQYTGLRPGEKLYEELLIDQSNVQPTSHERIVKSFEKQFSLDEIQSLLAKLQDNFTHQDELDWILGRLEYFVDGYHRSKDVVVN